MLQLFLLEKKILTDYHKIFLEIKTVTSQYILIQYFSRKCSITTNTEYICENTWVVAFYAQALCCVCVSVCVHLVAQFSSVASLCPFCNPTDCSTLGFPVLHHLPELAQTHVHWVGDAIQPSHPLLSPSPPAFNLSQL